MKEYLSVLIIEDDPDDVCFLTTLLNQLHIQELETQWMIVLNLEEAMEALHQNSYTLIITDLHLPDSKGLNTFLEIQKKAGATPIIIVGGPTEEDAVHEAIKLGAQDYLSQSDLTVALLSRIIQHAIERHQLHESLKALSFTDELTKVYNRRGFLALLEQQMSLSRRTKRGFFLFIIDVDYLKHINDTYGHLVGDRALVDTAKYLNTVFRRHDIIGRLGGDEFGIVAINATYENKDYLKAQLLEYLTTYNSLTNEPYLLSFSMGIAYFDGTEEISVNELLHQADIALYKEKRITHERIVD